MGKTFWILAMVALVASSMTWISVSAAEEEMCVPIGERELSPLTPKAQREAVTFKHNVHFSISCKECHHKWNYDTPITGCSAAGCHDVAEAPRDKEGRLVKDPAQQIKYFKNAYHQMCIGCHKEIKQKNKKIELTQMPTGKKLAAAGPTGCIECHPKE